jgi:outer membrane immunogenic protein
MRHLKFLLASTTILACGPALAADLGYPVKAPIAVMVPGTNWNGFYIGAFGGYASGDYRDNTGGDRLDKDGAFGGGLIGYNWQFSNWVLGIEADIAGGDISTDNFGGFRSRMDYFGTVRGRLGYAWSNMLLYGTGGYAYAGNSIRLGSGARDEANHSGYAVGGGLEWAFSQNWSAKVEYLYMDFDSERYFGAGGFDARMDIHTIKAGVNYRFNWGGPIVAAY